MIRTVSNGWTGTAMMGLAHQPASLQPLELALDLKPPLAFFAIQTVHGAILGRTTNVV